MDQKTDNMGSLCIDSVTFLGTQSAPKNSHFEYFILDTLTKLLFRTGSMQRSNHFHAYGIQKLT